VSKRDYYEILGVVKTATEVEIKSAYRKLAVKFHPDKNPGDKASEDKFKEAAEAYAVLADTDKRHMYDRFGHAGLGGAATGGFDPNTFSGFEDILGGLGDIFGFGDAFGGRRRGGPQRGADSPIMARIEDRKSFMGIWCDGSARAPSRSVQPIYHPDQPHPNHRKSGLAATGQKEDAVPGLRTRRLPYGQSRESATGPCRSPVQTPAPPRP
jgi:curved DNA-binding protein CbpA